MEPRLFEASRSGDISAFLSLLQEDPFLLDRVGLNSVDNPLHISVLAGQTEITKQIVSRKPAFARELNENGFSPMHVASANGHIEIIRELMRVGYDICLLKGKDGKVPLHCAALKGRVDVVKELVWACPESVKELTAFGETALHLAVKSNQIEAARVLIEEMRRLDMMEILNWKDKDGNTILHQATFNRQHEIIGLLIGHEGVVSGMNVNVINSSGITPKDVLDVLLQSGGDCYDIQIYQMFQKAGAVKARELTTEPANVQTGAESFINTQISQSSCTWNLWKELMKEVTESSTETQNALMVVAVLIATVTYQAILSPPSGFWSAEKGKSQTITVQKRATMPGEAVMASDPEIFAVFTVFNAIGFFASLGMISLLTSGFPLRAGLRLAILSMTGTYVIAVIYMGPTKMREIYIVVILMGILFLAELARFTMWLLKKWGVVPDTRRWANAGINSCYKQLISVDQCSTIFFTNSQMDNERLFEAARTGNIEVLYDLLVKNPLILTDVALSCSTETPLHVAVKAGQLDFVHQIMKHKPEFAAEMSKDGYRPLDIAVVTGHIDIVRQLLKTEFQICRLPGQDQRTALHYAAAKGRVEIINELISTCPRCITDVTSYGETALHLAVKNNQFPAFSVLVNWLENLKEKTVINFRDRDGNSVLHLAAARRQYSSLELLIGKNNVFNGMLEVNAPNSKGLTAMDILDIVMEEPNDIQMRKILQNDTVIAKRKQSWHDLAEEPLKDWFKYFKFQLERDSPSDTRNVLLVVAALIASVTFQAGLNPPSGLLEYDSQSNPASGNVTRAGPAVTSALVAASALLGTQATSYLFLFWNSFGITASLSIIIYLTGGFPFQRELLISMLSMMFSYGFSIYGMTEKDGVAFVLLTVAFVLPFALRWLPTWVNKAWNWWRGPPTSWSFLAIGG
ncbi:hypothetical protein QUC31_005616 [Theobroma cacao]